MCKSSICKRPLPVGYRERDCSTGQRGSSCWGVLEAASWAPPAASSHVSQQGFPGDLEQLGDHFRAGPPTFGLDAPRSHSRAMLFHDHPSG